MLDRDRLGEFNFGLIFRFSRIGSTLETLDSNDISGKCSTSTNCRMDRRVFAAVVAEWLRRLTRNQIPSGSVGSNPTGCEGYFFLPIPAARDSKSVYFYVKSTSTNCPIDKHFVYRFIRCPRFALLGANFTC